MKLQPTRSNAQPIADLDAIVSDTKAFQYKGRLHHIKPISFEDFLKFTQAQVAFNNLMDEKKITTPDELVNSYHSVISSVCDSITKQDIREMAQVQVAALYQLIIDIVTGQVITGSDDDLKKKRMKLDIYNQLEQPKSLQNARLGLVGRFKKLFRLRQQHFLKS